MGLARVLFWTALALILSVLLSPDSLVYAQVGKPPTKPAEPRLRRLPDANDAYALAAFDLNTLPASVQPFIRYVWDQDGNPSNVQALSLLINEISRASGIYRPAALVRGDLVMARIDLSKYAPLNQGNDLRDYLRLWEELQFDPALNLLITPGTLEFAVATFPKWKGRGFVSRTKSFLIDVPAYKHSDGQTYTKKYVKRKVTEFQEVTIADLKDIELIRFPDPTINPELFAELYSMTGSQAPVVTMDYFVARASATIEDDGLFKSLYGGLYYKFADIPQKSKKGTDLDNLLEQLGVGNVAQGITAKQIFERLRSDQRAALFRSEVTGNPRMAEFIPTLATKLVRGTALASFTHDLRNKDIDVNVHPIANLVQFKQAGTEGIFPRRNGLHGYGAWNANEELVNEVPFDIASDHTILPPYTRRLQSSVSCKACHEAEGSMGWKLFPNDVLALTSKGRPRMDIFGDISRRRDFIADTIDRLVGLYQADPEDVLSPGRESYSAAVLKATGSWKESTSGQTDVVKLASGRLVKIWRRYFHELVTPERALRELRIGLADPKEAEVIFNALMAPELRAAVPVPELNDVLIPEDVRIGGLRAGLSISRYDWNLVRVFAAERTRHRLATLMRARK